MPDTPAPAPQPQSQPPKPQAHTEEPKPPKIGGNFHEGIIFIVLLVLVAAGTVFIWVIR